jgi:3'-phosphoadenosine 5'-phosphosulfate sulfotransferase (PAPS reductase)/FAD synthetase
MTYQEIQDFLKRGGRIKGDILFHVGISGGKDSAAVLLWMVHESGIPKDLIKATFCDIGNDHDWTIKHVQLLSETVHPIETIKPKLDFFQLAEQKKRFPSAKARFCTEFLKIRPTQELLENLIRSGKAPIAVSGVRGDESYERSQLDELDFADSLGTYSWRPLLKWTIKDVYDIHTRYNVPLNPLYAIGAQRVGCWPCIMSRKAEIRNIALRFPERIDEIRKAEQKFETDNGRYSSFFARNTVPPRFRTKVFIQDGEPVIDKETGKPMMIATIDDVVKWSMTGNRAQGSYLDEPEIREGCKSGFCE